MRFSTKIALASVSLLSLSVPAYAADAAAEGEEATTGGDEIIVQARRKDESVQDVPMVVQAVTSAQLQKLEIRQFEDMSKVVPGLNMSSTGSSFTTSSSMRGVNFDSQASGSYSSVEFYRNDAVITPGALFQQVYDIAQVEVLRGPQGTLRGRATPSGSVSVTTRRPDLNEVGGYVSASASDAHRWNGNAAINVPIIEGKLGVRIAGFVGESRGNGIFGRNTILNTTDKNIYSRNRALRASVRADPLDGVLVLDFNYEAMKHTDRQYDQVESFSQVDSTQTQPVGVPVIKATDRLGVTPMPRSNDQDFKIYNWQAKLRLFGQALTYVGEHVSASAYGLSSSDSAGLLSTAVSPASPNNLFAQITNNPSPLTQTMHELRLQNEDRLAGIFDYVIGGMMVKGASPTLFNRVSASVSGAGYPNYTLNNVTYSAGTFRFRNDQEKSLFGNVTAHLGDKVEVSGGIRRIWYYALSGVKAGAPYPPSGDPASVYANQASVFRCYGASAAELATVGTGLTCNPVKTATIYAASAKYKITDDIMVYGNYGTSFRPGNSVVGWRGASVGSFLNQFLNLPDEKSRAFEVGFKTTWLDKKLRFNISFYTQKFTNYAFRVSSPVLALTNTNDPATDATQAIATAFNFVAPVNAKIDGMEADLAWDVSPNFNMSATVAYANGKIKGGVFPCLDLNNDGVPDTTTPTVTQLWNAVGSKQIDTCTADASPSSASKWSGSVQGEYSRDLSNTTQGYLRGLLSWKGNSDGFQLNPYDQVSGYGLLDLFVGVRDPKGSWDVSVYAKNLLDTKRVLTRTDSPLTTTFTSTPINTTQYMGITSLDPREFGINVRFAFGSR